MLESSVPRSAGACRGESRRRCIAKGGGMKAITRVATIGMLWSVLGLLILALWPQAAPAQPAAPPDTLQAVIKRGELIVGTFDFFPPWGFRDTQNNIVGM